MERVDRREDVAEIVDDGRDEGREETRDDRRDDGRLPLLERRERPRRDASDALRLSRGDGGREGSGDYYAVDAGGRAGKLEDLTRIYVLVMSTSF